MLRVAPAVLLLVALASPSSAQDRWSAPHAGIHLLRRRTPGPVEVRAVLADLCTPGLRVRATRPEERGRTLSSFAQQRGAVAAINGDFYARGFVPVGLAIGDGARWPGTRDDGRWGLIAFGEGRVEVPASPADPPAEWMHEALGGVPQIVVDGVPVATYTSRFCSQRHPRSAVGFSEDGRTLILATVDGRSSRSVGATCAELAELMAELGAWQALNLDGGGSTGLYVGGRIVTSPSDGAERPVANHLALLFGDEGVDACPPRIGPAAWAGTRGIGEMRHDMSDAVGPASRASGLHGGPLALASLGGLALLSVWLAAAAPRRSWRVNRR